MDRVVGIAGGLNAANAGDLDELRELLTSPRMP
jgi:hypothetical protein